MPVCQFQHQRGRKRGNYSLARGSVNRRFFICAADTFYHVSTAAFDFQKTNTSHGRNAVAGIFNELPRGKPRGIKDRNS
jgi:hypothetical protein